MAIKNKVFISYSRKNIRFAKSLRQRLEALGMTPWMDVTDIPKGANWREEIYKAIDRADAVIYIVSPASIESKNCNEELDYAFFWKKRVLPVIRQKPLKNKNLRKDVSSLNWVYCRNSDELNSALVQLLEAVNLNLAWIDLHTKLGWQAKEWQRKTKQSSYLIRGRELDEAEKWLLEKPPLSGERASPGHIEFVHASRKLGKAIRRRFLVAIGFFILLGFWGLFNRQSALERHTQAESERIAGLAINTVQENLELSSLLAVEASKLSTSSHALRSLLTVLQENPYLERYLFNSSESRVKLAFDPSGKGLAMGQCVQEDINQVCLESEINYWGLTGNQPIHSFRKPGNILALDFISSDLLVAGGSEQLIFVLNIKSGNEHLAPIEMGFDIWDIATASADLFYVVGRRENAWLCSLNGVCEISTLISHDSPIAAVELSHNMKLLASAGFGTFKVWDLEREQLIYEQRDLDVDTIAFSSDDSAVTYAGSKGAWFKSLYSSESGTFEFTNNHSSIILSQDGNFVATPYCSSYFGGNCVETSISFWDIYSGEKLTTTVGPVSNTSIFDLAISPDGTRLVASDTNGVVVVVELSFIRLEENLRDSFGSFPPSFSQVAISHSGELVAISSYRRILLWNWKTNAELLISDLEPSVTALSFSRDDRTLIAGFSTGEILTWKVNNAMQDGRLSEHTQAILDLERIPGTSTIASLGEDNLVVFWDLASETPVRKFSLNDVLYSADIAISPDGNLIAVSSCDNSEETPLACKGRIDVFDTETDQAVGGPFFSHTYFASLVFVSDTVLAGSDGSVHFWDVSQSSQFGPSVELADSPSMRLAYSPTLNCLISLGSDGRISFIDIESRRAVGEPISSAGLNRIELKTRWEGFYPDSKFLDFALSQSTQILVAVGEDQLATFFNLNIQAWQEAACRRAGRNFTKEEWETFFPMMDYHTTCNQWLIP